MAIRTNQNDPWHGPGSAFEANQGPPNDSDQFGQIDTRGMGLRGFVQRETTRAASMFESATSETIAPGIYLRRQQGSGDFELLVRHTRGNFLTFYGTKEEMLEIAEQKIGERNGNRK